MRMEDDVRRLVGNERAELSTPPSTARSQSSGGSRRRGESGAVPVQADRESYVRQIKVVPTFDGTKPKFPVWRRSLLCLVKLHGLFEILRRV